MPLSQAGGESVLMQDLLAIKKTTLFINIQITNFLFDRRGLRVVKVP